MNDDRPVVIVIDDDPEIRNALQGLLETVDLKAALFATASEFLARKRPQGPCCIVVDVRLPGLSGLDFQQELARENIPIPVIFITGHGDIPMSVRAMKAGAVEFLTKPLHDQDLLDAITGRPPPRSRAAGERTAGRQSSSASGIADRPRETGHGAAGRGSRQ